MDLELIHEWLDFICNKKLGTYFSPPENDQALERGQMDEFNEQKKMYANSQDVQDTLSVFKKNPSFISSSSGLITFPSDYEYLLALQANVMDGSRLRTRDIELVNEDELAKRQDSQLNEVTELYPVGVQTGDKTVQAYPETTKAGYIRYLSKPPAPNFVYTQVGRVITYNQAASTQMLWSDSSIEGVMIRALQYLGVSVEDGDLASFAQAKIMNPTK